MLAKTTLFLSAALGLSLLSATQPAKAQVIFMERRPSVIVRQQPAVIIRQQPSVIVREQPAMIIQEQRSVVTSDAPSAVLEQMPTLVPGGTVIQRSVNQSVLVPTAIGPISDFRHRLELIRDQISLGLQNGMMTADSAADLTRRYSDLSAFADRLAANLPISQADNDSLEYQINILNQDVAHQMGQ